MFAAEAPPALRSFMAAPSEIEKLERRFAENPDGRFFAPLADAYRKAGNVDRALELVRSGIEKHPDYLSAHIVLGRCLLDKNDDAEAERTFRAVLDLDAENIIALKSLAEISERTGRTTEARQWLQKLLVVDSMNVEAEADLQRLGGVIAKETTQPIEAVRADAGAEVSFADVAREVEPEAGLVPPFSQLPASLAPAAAPESPAAPPPAAEVPAAAPVAAWEPPPPAPPEETGPPFAAAGVAEPLAAVPDHHPLPTDLQVADSGLDLMPFDDSLAWGTGERSSRAIRAEDIAAVTHDDSLTTPAGEFLSGMETTSLEEMSSAGSAPGEPPAADLVDFSIERVGESPAFSLGPVSEEPPGAEEPVDLSRGSSLVEIPEPPRAAGGEERREPAHSPTTGLPLIMPEDVTPAEELARPSAKFVQLVSPTAPPEERAGPAEQPMLTETLGDLYLSQGFRSEAADVYRRLLSQRPGDGALKAKLRALEGPPADLSAAALGAESVGAWLQRVANAALKAPPPRAPVTPPGGPSPLDAAFAAPSADPVGEPAHPAHEAFSLDQIFGAAGGAPAPAAPGAAPPPAPGPAPGASFDEFFGAPPDAASVRPAAETPDAQSQDGDEDLSAFNAWLQGLKR
jgi:tetratricopeptide (TPR) repeat protein